MKYLFIRSIEISITHMQFFLLFTHTFTVITCNCLQPITCHCDVSKWHNRVFLATLAKFSAIIRDKVRRSRFEIDIDENGFWRLSSSSSRCYRVEVCKKLFRASEKSNRADGSAASACMRACVRAYMRVTRNCDVAGAASRGGRHTQGQFTPCHCYLNTGNHINLAVCSPSAISSRIYIVSLFGEKEREWRGIYLGAKVGCSFARIQGVHRDRLSATWFARVSFFLLNILRNIVPLTRLELVSWHAFYI